MQAESDSATATSTPQSSIDLAELVERMQSDDQLALETLYDVTVNKVYRFALSFMNSPADAEEVTEDVYFRAWRNAATFDADRGSVMTWLLTMCRSMALDRLRAARRSEKTKQAMSAEAKVDVQFDADLSWGADGTRLHGAIKQLGREQAQVLQLAYFGGYSHSEIAARLDMKLGSVKTLIRRTVEQLRRSLAP